MTPARNKLLLVTDAWLPQVNGVVRTLQATIAELEKAGYCVEIVAPGQSGSLTFALPFYKEIRLEPFGRWRIANKLDSFEPDFVHIATEGPLGGAARRLCLQRALRFTTAYHTCFPEYLAARVDKIGWLRGWGGKIAAALSYRFIRNFHRASSAVLVATPAIAQLLRDRKVAPDRLALWSRGVDMTIFTPGAKDHPTLRSLPRPIALYVGRVAIEKNIRAFLDAPFTGSKVLVGDGPELAALRAAYPAAHFTGAVQDQRELAACYRTADLFVFPSRTDTFGLVLVEAMACGLPVVACPGPGQNAIFAQGADPSFFVIDEDLARAMRQLTAVPADPALPRAFVQTHYSWQQSTQQFIAAMQDDKPPLEHKLLHRLIFDYLLGIPLGLLERIPGLFVLRWGGRKLFNARQRYHERRARAAAEDRSWGDTP